MFHLNVGFIRSSSRSLTLNLFFTQAASLSPLHTHIHTDTITNLTLVKLAQYSLSIILSIPYGLTISTTTQTHSFKGSLSLTLDVRSHAVALLLTRWIRIIEALPPPPPPSRLCSGKLLLLFLLLLLMMIPKCQSHFLSRRRQKILPPIKDPPCHREVYLPIAVAVSCR